MPKMIETTGRRKGLVLSDTHAAAEEKSYPVIPSREKFNKFTLCVKTYCRKNYLQNVAAQGNECNHKIVNKIEWKYKINAVWRQMETYC